MSDSLEQPSPLKFVPSINTSDTAQAEFVATETAVLKAIMEHLGCSLQFQADEIRVTVYCRECCHSYNIPLRPRQ